MDFRWSSLPASRPLQHVCHLRLTRNYGLNSCKPLCENLQARPAVQAIVYNEKVARIAFVCMDFCCLLHCNSTFGRPSSMVFVPGYAQCSIAHLSESGKIIHYSFVVTLFFLTPLVATTISYTKVAKVIRQHNAGASSTIQRKGRISSHEIKLSKSLFVIMFAFMICWIPFWIIVILRRFHLVAKMPRNVELFCTFLFYLSNTINPLIYAGMNPAFRREFRKVLSCERRRKLVVSSGGRVGTNEDLTQSTLSVFFRNRVIRQKNYNSTASGISQSPDVSEFCQIEHGQLKTDNNCG